MRIHPNSAVTRSQHACILVQEQKRLWRRFQQYLLTGCSRLDTESTGCSSQDKTLHSAQRNRSVMQQAPSGAAAQLTEALAAAVAVLVAHAELPRMAEGVQLAPVQPVTAKQRKHLPDSVQYTSAAALPIAAGSGSMGRASFSAARVADLLARALNDRYCTQVTA